MYQYLWCGYDDTAGAGGEIVMDFTAEGILGRMKEGLKNEDTRMEGSFSMDNLQAVSEELARFHAMGIVPLMSILTDKEEDMGTSGNERHYVRWAKEATDAEGNKFVGNAKVNAPRDGTGLVSIAILTLDATAPTEEQIKIVQEYIDSMRPVGANPVVAAAQSIPVHISCTAKLESGYTKETAESQVKTLLQQYFLTIAFQSNNVELNYYKICNIISEADGIRELRDVTVNDGRESLTADYNKYFAFEELIINVVK